MKKFDKKTYVSLLDNAIKNNYVISGFKNYKKDNKLRILLRHDVDLHVETALEMAKAEKELGIYSTYFILLYNDFYNPLSPQERANVKKIAGMGHEIGIHWDSRDYQTKSINRLEKDVSILSEIAGQKIISGSQHEPVETPMMKISRHFKHEAYRDFKSLIYISDSSMKWRQSTPWELIKDKQSFQFLAHPFWWFMRGETRKEKFLTYLKLVERSSSKRIIGRYKDVEAFLKIRDAKDREFKLRK